jgi:hypothetical protein
MKGTASAFEPLLTLAFTDLKRRQLLQNLTLWSVRWQCEGAANPRLRISYASFESRITF